MVRVLESVQGKTLRKERDKVAKIMVVDKSKMGEALEFQKLEAEVRRLRKLVAAQQEQLSANRAKLKAAITRRIELAPIFSPLRKRIAKPVQEPLPEVETKPVLSAGELGLTD
jgi:hypothetical protein